MATSVRLIPLDALKGAIVTATSEAAGYPVQNLLDFNPDTGWKAANTNDVDIVLDLGRTYQINRFAYWVRNYGASATPCVKSTFYSDNGSSWTTIAGATNWVQWQDTPFHFGSSFTATPHRYYKITLSAVATILELAGVFPIYDQAIALANELPVKDQEVLEDVEEEGAGGRVYIAQTNSIPSYRIQRTYMINGDANLQLFRSAFLACGRRVPLILIEDNQYEPNAEEYVIGARLVRFDQKQFVPNKIRHLLYNPSFQFRSVPYIPYGASF